MESEKSTLVFKSDANSNGKPSSPPCASHVTAVMTKDPPRETWASKADFLLALIGFSVGLGNVWRFPYLCYKNGGGAFFIPYFACVFLGGIPLLFLEISLGQYMSRGGFRAWAICPLMQGIGWTTTLIIFFVNCYYEVILAWAFFYLFASFTTVLPWENCSNEWNTIHCNHKSLESHTNDYSVLAGEALSQNSTWSGNQSMRIDFIDPATEYWENKVLGITDKIEDIGGIKWDLCFCLFLSWLIIFFCICKGVKSTGKVVYFTATFPYVLMSILLVRGLTLPGAGSGIYMYLVPDFSKLTDFQVWVDAGTQVFFSYGIGISGLTSLGSYNTRNHNSYRDALAFSACNSGTSIIAGFLIFSVLGFMAHESGVDISIVAKSGPGLAFIAYPKAVSQMPVAPLWSVLFFFMIILLGIDSQFVGVEGLITAVTDVFPVLRKNWKIKTSFIAITVFVHFLVGIPMVTRGGMYVFQLFDYYPASRIVVLAGFFECITIAWIYGVNKYYKELEMMLGFKLNPWMKICWVGITPVYCSSLFILSTLNYSTLTYLRPLYEYIYPGWAIVLGWSLALVPMAILPITTVYNVINYACMGKPLRMLLEPENPPTQKFKIYQADSMPLTTGVHTNSPNV